MTVRQAYEAELAAKGFASDPAQLRAIDALERCADEWSRYKAKRSNSLKKLINHPDIPKGVYMYGGVGLRGRSWSSPSWCRACPAGDGPFALCRARAKQDGAARDCYDSAVWITS